jgi:hypothetical protein
MLGTFCVLLALPAAESSSLDGLAQAIERTCTRFHISGLTSFAALWIVLSNIYIAAARLPFAAGIDDTCREFLAVSLSWLSLWALR